MKKVLGSIALAGLLLTNANANDISKECASHTDKIGFAAIGIAQGAVIGGPIGAIWGLGTVIYANMYDDCTPTKVLTESKNQEEIKEPKKEETITLITQQGSINNDSKMSEVIANEEVGDKLNKIQEEKTIQKAAVSKEFNSFVNFDYDRYNVKFLNTDLKVLNLENASKVTIQGHTDSKGTDEYNFALGLKRAEAVKKYLVSKNVDKNKLTTMSFGETAPISSNNAANRRVDLVITYK